MKTAIITGASSGLGREYAIAIKKKRPEIKSIWLIARRGDKLLELAEEIGQDMCFILALDLTTKEGLEEYSKTLKDLNPDVALLINNAGFGKLAPFEEIDPEVSGDQVTLNCTALTVVTGYALPFMKRDAEIINIASIASFAPNPNMTVYCSTKAYVLSFSKGLREELKRRGINVLAVCPGPMDTEFLPVANIAPGTSKTFDTLPRTKPKRVAVKSLKVSKKKKAVYTPKLLFKFYRVLAKILPHNLVMKFSKA